MGAIDHFHHLYAHAHNCFRRAKMIGLHIVNKDSPTNVS